ncbi:hypothetical protein TNCT_28431 [Trichonephila clavata]|uniref:Uncharacterized protein n=1 Tax=Trichonephila clavata TaxID=2740835 RepID=A0A8X6HQ58_TRICU|nr:hypothetical protein TNCT_28431 [Trichonephila clavata]
MIPMIPHNEISTELRLKSGSRLEQGIFRELDVLINFYLDTDVYFLHGNTGIERNKKPGCLPRLTSVRMGNYRECSDDSPGALLERSPVGHSEKVASRRKR